MSPNSSVFCCVPGASASNSARSSATLSHTSLIDAHSKPIFAARFEIFWACISAGRDCGTESRRPSVCTVSSALARSSALTLSHTSKTAAADDVEPASGPNTCGCLRTSFWLSARHTSSMSKLTARSRAPPVESPSATPLSASICEWRSTCSSTSPSSSSRCSGEPSAIASTAS